MSNTSHELKTPLTVIRTNAELLHDEIGENKHLQYIQQETDRMISMVNQMLTLMRLDGHEASRNCYSYRVDEALYNVIYPMESIAYEKKLQIDTHIQEELGRKPEITLDWDCRLRAALWQIIMEKSQ